MRIFDNPVNHRVTKRAPVEKSTVPQGMGSPNDRPIIKKEKPSDFSAREIRNKIEQHKEQKEQKNIKKLEEAEVKKDKLVTAMPDDVDIKHKSLIVKPEVEEKKEPSMLLKSDVDKNDPNDTNVQEKLKTILKTGEFSFSQKEKDALSQILNKD